MSVPWFSVRNYTRPIDYNELSREAIVREIQYMVGASVDGVFGPRTQEAAIAWLRAQPSRVVNDEVVNFSGQAASLAAARVGDRIPSDAWQVLAINAMVRLAFPRERVGDIQLFEEAIPRIASAVAAPQPPRTTSPSTPSTPSAPSSPVIIPREPLPGVTFGTPVVGSSQPPSPAPGGAGPIVNVPQPPAQVPPQGSSPGAADLAQNIAGHGMKAFYERYKAPIWIGGVLVVAGASVALYNIFNRPERNFSDA